MKISRRVIRSLCLFGLWLGLGLQAHAQTSTVTYIYTDPQGTPLAEADASGNVTARYDYTPYGNPVASLGAAPNGPGYTGHVNDPDTGLVYMQARYYDPQAHMLSPDPVGPTPGNIFGFNRYDYANNNPITNTDPTGMFPSGMTGDQISCEVYRCQSFVSGDNGGGSGNDGGGQIGRINTNIGMFPGAPGNAHSDSVDGGKDNSKNETLLSFIMKRSSATAEGSAALGGGFSISAIKEGGASQDLIKGSFVIGEGAMVGAAYNFKLLSSEKETAPGIGFTADPSSYLHAQVGFGLSLGFDASWDPHGAWDLSLSIGTGIGEEAIYKPPVTVGGQYYIP